MAPSTNIQNLHGVVALKVLTNNLLAAAYTNGLIRIVQVSNFEVIAETNILANGQANGAKVVQC